MGSGTVWKEMEAHKQKLTAILDPLLFNRLLNFLLINTELESDLSGDDCAVIGGCFLNCKTELRLSSRKIVLNESIAESISYNSGS